MKVAEWKLQSNALGSAYSDTTAVTSVGIVSTWSREL